MQMADLRGGIEVNITRCQDRACPMQMTCLRYDPTTHEDATQAYFASSPRSRTECAYYIKAVPHNTSSAQTNG